MSEEKDVAQVEAEMAALEARGGDVHNGVGPKGASGGEAVPPQLEPSPGLPERRAVRRRQERVARMLHTFDPATADAIRASLPPDLLSLADAGVYQPTSEFGTGRHWRAEPGAEIAATGAGAPGPRGER
jgi:phospholipid/cholesterol/gamma-HCH transport system ATP-binding protein